VLHEVDRENRCHRSSHDPTRRHEGEEDALTPVELGAPGGERDRDGAHYEDQCSQEGEAPRTPVIRVAQGQARGQDDEQDRDQEHPEVLLELHDLPHRHEVLARQGSAHDGHRKQAGLRLELVRCGEHGDHDGERDRTLQVIRDPVALEQQHDYGGSGESQSATDHRGLERAQRADNHPLFEPTGDDRLEH
jgi:hypothetical protein